MARKKVLIITYYWPPSGGSGVQRWVKFVKYLRDFGWEPVIYTTSNPEFPVIDYSLEKDIPKDIQVIRQPIWEPYQIYKKFVGLKKDSRLETGIVQEKKGNSLPHRISVWIRGNFFIPDARKFWIKSSTKFLTNYLAENNIDVVVSNGTPHSLHLIGLKLKEKTGCSWLADFRDPWTKIDYFEDLKLSSWAREKHHKLEQKVLTNADCVTVTTPSMKSDFIKISGKANVHTITNGFDEDDFKDLEVTPDTKFVIAHIGVLTPSRNHPFLWDLLKELVNEDEEFARNFVLRLIGKTDQSILDEIENRGLTPNVEVIDYIPHDKIITEEKKARVLLLVIRNAPNKKSIIPGKIFEYLAAKRPVISIGPKDSDSANILSQSNTGETFSEDDRKELKQSLLDHFEAFKEGRVIVPSQQDIKGFSRRELTRKMSSLLDSILK